MLTDYHAKYIAHELTRRCASDSVEKLTAVWLLPIVASEVAAASGGLLAAHLAGQEAFLTLILSYVLWACSVPLAMSVSAAIAVAPTRKLRTRRIELLLLAIIHGSVHAQEAGQRMRRKRGTTGLRVGNPVSDLTCAQ